MECVRGERVWMELLVSPEHSVLYTRVSVNKFLVL